MYEALSAAMERTYPYASPAWANPLTTRPPWTAWISKTYHGLGASGTRNEREDPVRVPASTTLLSASRISYTKEGLGIAGEPVNVYVAVIVWPASYSVRSRTTAMYPNATVALAVRLAVSPTPSLTSTWKSTEPLKFAGVACAKVAADPEDTARTSPESPSVTVHVYVYV